MRSYILAIIACFLATAHVKAADFAFVQKGAPLQVVGTHMDLTDFYKRVIVVNVSPRKILRAQFGWTMSEIGAKEMDQVVVGFGPPVDLNLPPSEVAGVGPQGATFSLITEMAPRLGFKHTELKIGVVQIKFEDGSEWSYPLQKQKRFVEVEDSELVKRISPKVRAFRQSDTQVRSARSTRNDPTINSCLTVAPKPEKSTSAPKPEKSAGSLFNTIAQLLGSIPTFFNPITVHAQQGGWIFICDQANRACVPGASDCTDYFCELGSCPNQRCCLLNLYTGQKYC